VYAEPGAGAACADSGVQPGWAAELTLGFARRAAKTVLAHRRQRGPLAVQRPFYPEGAMCHVYLLHPPGGVVAGDRLAIGVTVAADAEALITTPGAGKFYRSTGARACQSVVLKIEENAVLEWLPQEAIIYQGARLTSKVTLELAGTARFIGWDIVVLGRPAAGEGFSSGETLLDWRILRDGKPLFLEKMRLDAKAFAARWGLQGHSCCGTLLACPATAEHLDAVRHLIADAAGQGVTLIDDLLICRCIGDNAEQIKQVFQNFRAAIRLRIVRREDYAPRIWAT